MYDHIDKQTLTLISGPFSLGSSEMKKAWLAATGTHRGNFETDEGLVEVGIVSRVSPSLNTTQKYGDVLVFSDHTEMEVVDKTPEELKADTYVYQITPRQCRLWLLNAGLLDSVEAAISGMGRAAELEWEFALDVKRDHSLVLGMQQLLGKTDDEMHEMFYQASQL